MKTISECQLSEDSNYTLPPKSILHSMQHAGWKHIRKSKEAMIFLAALEKIAVNYMLCAHHYSDISFICFRTLIQKL